MQQLIFLKRRFSAVLGVSPTRCLNQEGLKYLGNYLNGSVGHTPTDPNALGESDLWVLNGNVENLSRLVEQGISNSDVERIPRYNAV